MSNFPDNRLLRGLRRLKQIIRPPDATRCYQKGLNRELSRVRRAFESSDQIVLTYTYGKVGSTTTHKAIRKLPGYQSFQNHFISEEGVAEVLRLHEGDHDPVHVLQGEAIRRGMEAHPDRHIKVITLVRDPVARALSSLFQHPTILSGNGDIRESPLEAIMATAEEQILYSLDYTEKWFDRELSALLGLDFFSRDFDRQGGFQIIREGRFELLSGKLERLSTDGAGHLGRFLDLGSDLPVPISHARSATGAAAVYDEVKRNLKLPADLLDKVYSSRVCRHFYTPEELEGFRKRWINS